MDRRPPRGPSFTETVAEEIANAVTHGIGAALAVAGFVALVVLAALHGGAVEIAGLAIYGLTLVLLYGASTAYHVVRHRRAKTALNLLDHTAIYLLIAGTYTPFTLLSLGGAWGWGLFAAVWALAAAGVVLRLAFPAYEGRVAVPLYLAMGWLGVIAIGPVWDALGPDGVFWIGAGGVAYTAGIAFYLWERLPFNHAVWHVFVLAGSACHFGAIAAYVAPWA